MVVSRDLLHSLPPQGRSGHRLHVLYRCRLDCPDWLIVDRRGSVGVEPLHQRIEDLLRTAAQPGWLSCTRRARDWYSAEWCSERRSVALRGPRVLPVAMTAAAAMRRWTGAMERS